MSPTFGSRKISLTAYSSDQARGTMWGAAKSSQKDGWTRRLQSTLHWLDGKVCRDVWKVRLHSRVSAQNQECGQILHAVLLTPKQGGNRKGLWAGAISCIMQTLSHLHQWNWKKRVGGGRSCALAWVLKKNLTEKHVTSSLYIQCNSVWNKFWDKYALMLLLGAR